MGFLDIEGKTFVVFGMANRKSVACAIAKTLKEEGAEIIHVVRSEQRVEAARKLFPDSKVFICDVENEENIIKVRDEIAAEIGHAPVCPREHPPARKSGPENWPASSIPSPLPIILKG